jgi:hypothetical protein
MHLARVALVALVLPAVVLAAATGCRKPTSDESGTTGTGTEVTSAADAAVAAPAPKKAAKRQKPLPPRPPQHLNPGPEALARKARSLARLKSEGVPTNDGLPVIDSEKEAKLRATDAVVDRALALVVVAVKGEGLEQDKVLALRDKLGAAAFLSPDEKDFVADTSPTDKDRAQFAWRYEGLGVLLWALGFDAELPRPAKIVDAARIVKLVNDKGVQKLREEARLRSAKEILDATDLVYRYDWACVAARMSSESPPKGVECEIVTERHHALNWLVGYQNQAWDDVSTDT